MNEFSALLLRLYALARDASLDEFRDGALELVRPRLSFDSSTWAVGRMTPCGFDFHSVHLHREAADRLERYEDVKEHDRVGATSLKMLGRTLNMHVPTVYRDDPLRAPLTAYAAAVGHQNGLIWSSVQPENGLIQWVAFYRRSADRQFSEHERQLSECLAPHLIEAQTTNRAVQFHPPAIGGQWHTAIVDQRGVLHHAGAGFAAALRAEWPQCEDWTLPRELLEALLSGSSRYSGRHLFVSVMRVHDLLFLKAREKIAADELSVRERLVARHVARGLTYKEIARLLGISPATVRNHIQAIYRRLDVHNKAELATQLIALDE